MPVEILTWKIHEREAEDLNKDEIIYYHISDQCQSLSLDLIFKIELNLILVYIIIFLIINHS